METEKQLSITQDTGPNTRVGMVHTALIQNMYAVYMPGTSGLNSGSTHTQGGQCMCGALVGEVARQQYH